MAEGDFELVSPEDLGASVLSLEVLAGYLTEIINDVRAGGKKEYNLLIESLKSLQEYEDKLDASSNLSDLFMVYEQLQSLSLQIRQLLSAYIPAMEVYKNISYAFYYNGVRYYADHINTDWLVKSNSTGELRLKMNLVEKEYQQETAAIEQQELREAFNKHYAIYLAAIKGTYKGILGRGGALNVGHIAEAYEAHNEEHHPTEYALLSGLFNSSAEMPVINKALIAYDIETDAVSYWANHEGIDAAWQHIRDALGTQRGTVAGDVGRMQVKQGRTGSAKIRLARLKTLTDGVKFYCDIINPDKPVGEVALSIAKYMSEPVRKMSAQIINSIDGKEIQERMQALNDAIDKLNQTQVLVSI